MPAPLPVGRSPPSRDLARAQFRRSSREAWTATCSPSLMRPIAESIMSVSAIFDSPGSTSSGRDENARGDRRERVSMIIDPSVIRQVSREKDIDAEKMFGALEEAMSSAARKYYHDKAMVTLIDRQTGAMIVYSPRTVVAELDTESEEPPPQILIDEAQALVGEKGTKGEVRVLRPGAEGEPPDRSSRRRARRRGPHLPRDRRPRPHRRADRQAGALPEGPRGRARQRLQRVLPEGRRADERHGQALRARRHDRRPRQDRGDHPARPAVARRALRPGRAHPRDPLRRPQEPEGTAARAVAHGPAAPDPALRDGGARDLRRHGRHQGRRPPAGRARQGRRALARARRRPGRRLRRHARQPRPVDHAGAPRREDRRHPLLRRPDHVRAERARAGQDHARLADPPRGRRR